MGQIFGELGLKLAESTILPLSPITFAQEIELYVDQVIEDYSDVMEEHGIDAGLGNIMYSITQPNIMLIEHTRDMKTNKLTLDSSRSNLCKLTTSLIIFQAITSKDRHNPTNSPILSWLWRILSWITSVHSL